ncbi:glycosyltransferase family 2 protein [Occultella kanbiaonis]|uniref:glycosyltransferase family 2 protein n=1 Tax=Occultella kanbiaonis TaxID=2675754 RepID=UPI0012B93838|nr:glycosyltransferase family 2 protein [Occultella kanbiaonis]
MSPPIQSWQTGSRGGEHGGLSVVIPALDDASALDRCLNALERQTLAPLEIIVVDNGSRDATAAVARRHGARLLTEPRRGIGPAAALGYDNARGQLIGRLDADSVPAPDWVARVSTAAQQPGVDAVTGTGWFYDGGLWARPVAHLYLGTYYVLCGAALGHPPLWGSNMVLRRSAWNAVRARVHVEDPEVHDDLDLAFALGPRARILVARDVRVGVSARSVRGSAQWRRRLRRAWHTLDVNWRVQAPWERWQARLQPAES